MEFSIFIVRFLNKRPRYNNDKIFLQMLLNGPLKGSLSPQIRTVP